MKMKAIGTDIDKEYIDFSKKRIVAENYEIQSELELN